MNKLTRLSLILLVLPIVLFSCKKDKDNLGSSAFTAFKVYVVDGNGNAVEGALVTIYDNESNRDAKVNSIYQKTTRSEGYASFTEIEAITYFVSVQKENLSGEGDTAVPIKSLDETAITVVLN